jgi:hypothetical protein
VVRGPVELLDAIENILQLLKVKPSLKERKKEILLLVVVVC